MSEDAIERLAAEVVAFAHDKMFDPENADPAAMNAATDAALAATEDNPKDCRGSGYVTTIRKNAGDVLPCPGCSHPECPNREAVEDCDDPCECGHERFAHTIHETVPAPCAVKGCGCKSFAPECPNQGAAERKEIARQAFVAGAEFAGVDLEEPDAQFERHWQDQLGHAADAAPECPVGEKGGER